VRVPQCTSAATKLENTKAPQDIHFCGRSEYFCLRVSNSRAAQEGLEQQGLAKQLALALRNTGRFFCRGQPDGLELCQGGVPWGEANEPRARSKGGGEGERGETPLATGGNCRDLCS